MNVLSLKDRQASCTTNSGSNPSGLTLCIRTSPWIILQYGRRGREKSWWEEGGDGVDLLEAWRDKGQGGEMAIV